MDHRVRRTSRGLAVDVVALREVDADALATQLVDALSAAGLPGPTCGCARCRRSPRGERTGTLRRFVPLG